MSETRQTTIRFGETLYRRLELAGEHTGLPINSIVIVACMEWLKRNEPELAYRHDFAEKRESKSQGNETEEHHEVNN